MFQNFGAQLVAGGLDAGCRKITFYGQHAGIGIIASIQLLDKAAEVFKGVKPKGYSFHGLHWDIYREMVGHKSHT